MHRHNGRDRALAALLAALAGYVDALGFLALGGFFVSFMSGNTTRIAVGLASGSPDVVTAGLLIATFVVGVMIGSLVGHFAGPRRKPVVLVTIATLLALAALMAPSAPMLVTAIPMVLAMGAENAIFEREGEVQIGLTYMTGTLVKLGQRAVVGLLGGPKWSWLPHLLLWIGLASGATLGAAAYATVGLQALWGGAAFAAVASLVTVREALSAPT